MFRPQVRNRVQFSSGSEMVTKQEFKDECNINNILTQFKKTGIITHIQQQQPIYSDLPDNLDYQSSINIIRQSEDAFKTLPSAVRRYFDNDPGLLLAALTDPDQRVALEQLGVLQGPDTPQPAGNPENRNPSVGGTLGSAPVLPVSGQPAAPPAPPPLQPGPSRPGGDNA